MPSTTSDQIDGISTSTAVKAPCKCATTANITLSGLQIIDGYQTVDGDRVVVKDQTDPVENGIYNAHATAWERAKDFDGARDARTGTLVTIDNLSENAIFYRVATANPIVIGTDEIVFEELFFGGSAANLLALLLTVDGPGSGLNADLLDGLSSAAFLLAASIASQAEAEAGSDNTKWMSALRVAQAITAQQRALASQAEAEAGSDNTKDMSPLRVAQAIAAQIPPGGFVVASQAEAEAGSDNTKGMTPLRTVQSIAVNERQIASQAEAEAGSDNTKDMSPLRVAQAIAAQPPGSGVPSTREVNTSGLATGGGDLSANRTIDVPAASQAEAEAGSDNAKAMTALRVAQAIAALQRAIASQAEAEAGSDNTVDMTPLRVAQAMAVKTITEDISGLFVGSVADGDYRIVIKLSHAITITETTTRCVSGTATATFKINTTALGGTANSVSSSEQSRAHASANAAVAGDDLVLTISSASSLEDLSIGIKYTRALG